MEDMRKAAVAFYRRSDPNQQKIAIQFFNQMDTDRNGKISPNEFLEALKQVDYSESKQHELAKLFKKLDSNFDKSLDFFEALPFYYLIIHKTALFCSGCSVLLVGKYFSCLDCHVEGGNSYDLCIVCYQKRKFNDHIHKSLYDNIHLLQIYRNLVADQNANRKRGDSTGSAGLSLGPKVIKQKTTLICGGCSIQLGSIYFSCLECHMKASDTCDLCIDCYDDGASDAHMHKPLCENNALLQIYRQVVANWKENKEGTHVTSREQKAGVGVNHALLGVGVIGLGFNIHRLLSVTGSHSSTTTQGGDTIGSSTSGPGRDGDALGTGSADPSLLMDIGGDVGTAGSDLARYGSSLPDVADQGTSLADFAEQGSSLADIAQQGSCLADAAQSGLGFADAAQSGLGFADAAQNAADLVDVASVILTACSIM